MNKTVKIFGVVGIMGLALSVLAITPSDIRKARYANDEKAL